MRYALLLYADAERARSTTPEEAAAELRAYAAVSEELTSAGVLVGGEAFLPAHTAKVVERRHGRRHLAAAASAARELSGFLLVDCDEDAAVDIASRLPVVDHGAVEVRPLMDLDAIA